MYLYSPSGVNVVAKEKGSSYKNRHANPGGEGLCCRCILRFPDQCAFSTDSMAVGLEERSPVDVRSAVLSWPSAEFAVRVPQIGIVQQ